MSTATLTQPMTTDDESRRRRGIVPAGIAFYLLASITVALLAGSSAPTPLYAVYQAEWGFSPITTTVVFGIYALAVLAGLLTVGSLSDHVGRRPVLMAAVAVQAATMVLFAYANGVSELMAARVVQGVSTGAALGAVGAGMLDLNRTRGTVANAVAPLTGTATGALLSGLFVQYLPAPSHLVYLALAGVFVVQLAGVALMTEPSVRRPGALASLKPAFAIPSELRRPLAIVTPVLVAAWALAGFYGSLAPALVREISGTDSFLLGGLALSALAAGGALAVLLASSVPARRMLTAGTATLLVGVGVTLVAVGLSLPVLFFVASAATGAGFGIAFQGIIRTIVAAAQPHQRAGVLSVVFVVSYLAMGVPAVLGGVLVVHGGGLVQTAREYGLGVMALAAVALLGLVVEERVRVHRAIASELPCGGPGPLATPC